MKGMILVSTLLVLSITSPQNSQTCGSGVVLRGNGAVLIDHWVSYDVQTVPPVPPGSPIPILPSTARYQEAQPKSNPTSVTIGQAVSEKSLICVEENSQTKCKSIKELREWLVK